jgi:hypothetical protein
MVTSTKRPRGIGETSEARELSTGSSSLLLCGSSSRSLARTQPFCTNVSLPSGRTSVMIACRSTLGVEERTHTCTAPAPMMAVLVRSGAVMYVTAVPAGLGFHS